MKKIFFFFLFLAFFSCVSAQNKTRNIGRETKVTVDINTDIPVIVDSAGKKVGRLMTANEMKRYATTDVDSAKSNIRSEISNNINYVMGISDTRDDSLKAAISEKWGISGNSGTNSSNFIGTTDSKDFAVKTNNIERLKISSDGNMLLGLNAPNNAKFNIFDSIAGKVTIRLTNNSFSPSAYTQFSSTAGGVGYWIYQLSTNYSSVSPWATPATTVFMSNDTMRIAAGGSIDNARPIIFMSAQAEKIRMTADGNFAIGTSTASEKLEVVGRMKSTKLQLTETLTPSSTSDTQGNVGDIAKDDNFIYIKTSTGWKRSALSTF